MHIGRQAIALDRVFAGLVAQGVGIWIGFQAFINMGVNLGALPTKGLTLPLMSYGGSAILMNVVAIAVVLRIDYENRVLMRGGRGMTTCALVMAGGTGGHIFPGLAVAEALRERGWRVHWLGAPGSMESQLVPPRGFAVRDRSHFGGVRGKGLIDAGAAAAAPAAAPSGKASSVVRRVQARRGGRPGRLHHLSGRHDERAAGQAAGAARAELGGRHGQQGAGRRRRPRVHRLPERAEEGRSGSAIRCARLSCSSRDPAAALRRRAAARCKLLVVGGSLGAKALNDIVPKALALIPAGAAADGAAPERRQADRRAARQLRGRRRRRPSSRPSSTTRRRPMPRPT